MAYSSTDVTVCLHESLCLTSLVFTRDGGLGTYVHKSHTGLASACMFDFHTSYDCLHSKGGMTTNNELAQLVCKCECVCAASSNQSCTTIDAT